MYAGVLACFVLSGFAALLYQTAWLQQFTLVFGTTELAVATVLAAYMGGLAAGAGIAGRHVGRVHRPVLVYGLLEAGIAGSALAVPLLVAGAGALYVALLGGQPEPPAAAAVGQSLYFVTAAFIALALPTGFMGATLPLLTRYAVRTDRQLGPRVALLYALNTAGAVAGAVAAAFILLPRLGLGATVWIGVAVNALIFALAVLLARRVRDETVSDAGAPDSASHEARPATVASESADDSGHKGPVRAKSPPPLISGRALVPVMGRAFRSRRAMILPLMAVSGANAFLYEVLWTRMLSHVLGGSIYAFATMLAAFLAGIALGSGLAAKPAEHRENAVSLFATVQAAIAVLAACVYAWVQPLVPDTRATAGLAAYAVAVMLPATVCIGATFPLAVRIAARNRHAAAGATASVYAWNTVGAIAGALLAGFLLVPALGFEGSIRLAVLVNLGIAVFVLVLLAPVKSLAKGLAVAALVAALVAYRPARPQAVISASVFALPEPDRVEEIHYAVGRSATVLLRERNGRYELRSNGLPEATVRARGAPPLGQVQPWLAALPIAARPDAESMLMVGFGGGVALEDLPPSVREVDVVEIEPEVLAANRALARRRAADPLQDERIDVIVNDARNALSLTGKRYDAILSQPSHPWTTGAAPLYTREFVSLAKARLNDAGLFAQWMSAEFVDAELLKSLVATLLEVFDNVRVYHGGAGALFLLASDGPLDVEFELARSGRPLNSNRLYFSYLGLNGVEDFVAALLLDEDAAERFAAAARPSTDDRNLMATRSRPYGDGLTPAELTALVEPYDPLVDAGSRVHARLADSLNFAYVAGRLLADGQIDRAARLAFAVADDSDRAMITGLVRGSAGQLEGVREAYEAALRADPANADARFALLEPELASLAAGRASDEARELARALPGAPAAVLQGWELAARGDYEGLARLDPALARSNVTDLWYPHATRLRADWRTRIVGETRHARDALRMIDRAALIRPDVDLFLLRAAAAEVLDDTDAFIESCRHAAEVLDGRLEGSAAGSAPISGSELEINIRRFIALRADLLEVSDDPGAASSDVAARIEQLLTRMQLLARAQG